MKFKTSDKIIIAIVAIVVIIPIIINQVKLETNKKIDKTVNKIVALVNEDKINNNYEIIEYVVDNGLKLGNKTINSDVVGKGVVFVDIDGSITVVLEYKDKCAIKHAFTDIVAIKDEKCPVFKLINGAKMEIVSSGDGLYQIDDNKYVYRGKDVNNYLEYDNKLWRILEIDNNVIKLVSDISIGNISLDNNNFLKSNAYNYLLDYYQTIDNKYIKAADFQNTLLPIRLLSIEDVVNASLESCEQTQIINCQVSYLGETSTWLMDNGEDNKSWYLYNDGNIYLDSVDSKQNLRSVVYLNDNIKIIDGLGVKDFPYQVTETVHKE
ncbi:MAG: hypothetical protein PHD10_01045 [Bacilli bacterium]|nr:hypothetical protein [Bacilli bacterium]MDD4607707.1 hypothetical protein [Bacilli bacterium]